MRALFPFLIMLVFPFCTQAQEATDYQTQLMALTRSVREAEKQSGTISLELEKLQHEEQDAMKDVLRYRLETAKAYHALETLRHSPQKNIFLLPDSSYKDHFYELRRNETLKDILVSRLNAQTSAIITLQDKQAQIKDYLQRRQMLSLTLDTSLQQLKTLSESRHIPAGFQTVIDDLKQESADLDSFMQSILNLPPPQSLQDSGPLVFTLPVSGIIRQESTGIYIKAAAQALVTTPARGIVVYAGEFEKLGKIVIINHGEGYISVLKNLGDIYVQEGFTLRDQEPIGTLPVKNTDIFGNSTMLYYELRYNHNIINPIEKITGL